MKGKRKKRLPPSGSETAKVAAGTAVEMPVSDGVVRKSTGKRKRIGASATSAPLEVTPKARKKKKTRQVAALSDKVASVSTAGPEERPRKGKRASVDVRSGLVEDNARAAEEAEGFRETEETLKADKERSLRLIDQVLDRDDDPGVEEEEELREGGRRPASSGKEDSLQERKVFVGGLPWRAEPDAVEDFFEKCGEIDSFNMPSDKVTGKFMGVAFIVFARRDGVEKALAFNGKTYGGQKIRVKVADPEAKGKSHAKDTPDGQAPAEGDWEAPEPDGQQKGKGQSKGKGKDKGKGKGKDKGKGKGKGKNPLKSIEASKKVWVNNIPENSDWKKLEAHFQQVGNTQWVEPMPRGTACIAYDTEEEAVAGLSLNGVEFEGQVLEVDVWEAPKTQ